MGDSTTHTGGEKEFGYNDVSGKHTDSTKEFSDTYKNWQRKSKHKKKIVAILKKYFFIVLFIALIIFLIIKYY